MSCEGIDRYINWEQVDMEIQKNGHYGWTEDHELSGGKLGEKKIACVLKVSGQSRKGSHVFRVKNGGVTF